MEPLSIVAAAFSIAGAVAKASTSIVEFSLHAQDAADDLTSVNQELHALNAILDPLARGHSEAPKGTLQPDLEQNLRSSLGGCELVVGKIEATIEKYQKDGAWTKTKWVMVGRGDMEKLRGSLEAYKMALGLGLQLITIAVEKSVKEDTSAIKDETSAIRSDTGVLRQDTSTIQVNMEEILARVMSIRNGPRRRPGNRTREWVDSMAALTSYAETTYQETIIDPADHKDMLASNLGDSETAREGAPLDTVQELDGLMLSEEETGDHATAKGSPRNPSSLYGLDGQDSKAATVGEESEENPVRGSPRPGENTPRAEDGSPAPGKGSPTPGEYSPMPQKRGDRGSRDESIKSAFSSPSLPSIFSSPTLTSSFSSPTFTSAFSSPALTTNDGSFTAAPNNKDGLDVVVVLDLGNTSAAVAWMTKTTPVTIIEDWPGGTGQRVPTMVVSDQDDNISSWGFECAGDTGPGKFHHQCSGRMKLGVPVTIHDRIVNRAWLTAFLREQYLHVKHTISSALELKSSEWEQIGIEFHFTLSDAFRSSETDKASLRLDATRKFKDVLRGSGFGTGGRAHCAVLGPTETEAAAIAVLEQWPVVSRGPWNALLSIGTTHATVVEIKRVESFDPKERLRSKSFPIPRLNTYIEETVSSWLRRDHPKIGEELGTDGVGPVVCDAEFQDMMAVLDGTARLRESYRLQFEHLPTSSRHGVFDIKDGTMQLSRKHVELILDGLVAKICTLVLDTLNGILCPEDRKAVHPITMVNTAETPLYLVELMKDTFEELQNADLKFRLSSAPNTRLGHRELNAIEGIFLQRNVWNFIALSPVACVGPYHPQVYLDSPTDESLKALWASDDESKGHQLFPFTSVKQSFGIMNNTNEAYAIPRKLSLPIYFTSDPHGRNTKVYAGDDPRLTKLCTATWTITPEDFFSFKSWRRKWYSKSTRKRRLDCELRVSMLHPLAAGPRLELALATDDGPPRLAETVVWHCEPPHIVWAHKTPVE